MQHDNLKELIIQKEEPLYSPDLFYISTNEGHEVIVFKGDTQFSLFKSDDKYGYKKETILFSDVESFHELCCFEKYNFSIVFKMIFKNGKELNIRTHKDIDKELVKDKFNKSVNKITYVKERSQKNDFLGKPQLNQREHQVDKNNKSKNQKNCFLYNLFCRKPINTTPAFYCNYIFIVPLAYVVSFFLFTIFLDGPNGVSEIVVLLVPLILTQIPREYYDYSILGIDSIDGGIKADSKRGRQIIARERSFIKFMTILILSIVYLAIISGIHIGVKNIILESNNIIVILLSVIGPYAIIFILLRIGIWFLYIRKEEKQQNIKL